MPAFAILLLLVVLAVCCLTLYKVRKLHLLAWQLPQVAEKESGNLFRQMESLLGLHLELDLKQSLPPLRGWAASPDFLLELARHARQAKPLTVVECSSGSSTLVLARCMQLNGAGKVYSLEHEPEYAQKTRDELSRLGLSAYAEVLDAPLRSSQLNGSDWRWYNYDVLPADIRIDLLAIDGPPTDTGKLARYPAGPALFGKLADNAAVFLDDAARPDEQEILARWRTEFPLLEQSWRYCEKGCAVLRSPAQRLPS